MSVKPRLPSVESAPIVEVRDSGDKGGPSPLRFPVRLMDVDQVPSGPSRLQISIPFETRRRLLSLLGYLKRRKATIPFGIGADAARILVSEPQHVLAWVLENADFSE